MHNSGNKMTLTRILKTKRGLNLGEKTHSIFHNRFNILARHPGKISKRKYSASALSGLTSSLVIKDCLTQKLSHPRSMLYFTHLPIINPHAACSGGTPFTDNSYSLLLNVQKFTCMPPSPAI